MAAQHDWLETDYYKVLGVSSGATDKEISKAFKGLARKYHPDANPGDKKAEERFKEVTAAHDVVGDEDKRKEYDEIRRLGPMGFGGSRGGGGGPNINFDTSDLGGMFGNLFGGGGQRGGGQGSSPTGPTRGADLEADLHLTFRDAVSGITTSVGITSEVACSNCAGSGASPGTAATVCPSCAGRGVLDDNQGFFSFSSPCTTCGGRGRMISDPCNNCSGKGVEVKPRNVKVRIPSGVADGQKIRLKGRGGPGRNGGPGGDLFINVHIAADELFGRKGDNLTIVVPVTFPEAALGSKITVPTLEDGSVTLKIPAGTNSGKTFRVKGHGVETSKGKGNLLVTVEIAVPKKLSKEAKRAVQALDDATPESPRDALGM